MLATPLGELDHVRFQFFIGLPHAGGFHRLKLPVVGEDRDIGAVERDVLNVNVVHQHVHFSVADEVSAKVVENLGLGFLVDFHAVGLDDLVHGGADVGIGVGINFFDVGREGTDENVHDLVSLLLLFLGERWFDDLVDDVQGCFVPNDSGKSMGRHDGILVKFIVLGSLLCALSTTAATAFFSCHGHRHPRMHFATTSPRL